MGTYQDSLRRVDYRSVACIFDFSSHALVYSARFLSLLVPDACYPIKESSLISNRLKTLCSQTIPDPRSMGLIITAA